jgi:hypothetical protein
MPPEETLSHLRGEVRDVDTARHRVYEREEPDPDDRETLLALTFHLVAEGTWLILDQVPFATAARFALHEAGWSESLAGAAAPSRGD